MKLEIIAPIEGKSWKVGHTVLVSDVKIASKLIKEGFAKFHPSITNPPDIHECPCKEEDKPCEECDEKDLVREDQPSKKAKKKRKK